MTPQSFIPDVSSPSLARVWDYLLARGRNCYKVDRDAVDEVSATVDLRRLAAMQRRFVDRVMQYLVVEAGVRQFIDIGSGFPVPNSVYDLARRNAANVRVVYVDNDLQALGGSRSVVADDRRSGTLLGDVRDPLAILEHPLTRRMLDLDEPSAVLLCGVLHHLPDEAGPVSIVHALQDALSPGSHIVTSGFLGRDDSLSDEAERVMTKVLGTPCRYRPWDDHARCLAGLEPIEPGLVYADDWRPQPYTPNGTPEHKLLCAGVGRVAG